VARPPSSRRSSHPLSFDASPSLDLLTWTERHLNILGEPERVPGPIRALYRDHSPLVVVMKGAQMTISEWVLNLCLYTADIGRAGRGTAFYVQPGGTNVGNFVQMRVNPIIDDSDYLRSRAPKPGSKDPDNVGLRRIGPGYTVWRTAYVRGRGARNTSGLKSVPADTLVLDEFDEMPDGTYDIAKHRLDSSRDPWTRIVGTPTFPEQGIDVLYQAGTRLRYHLTCESCGHEQALEWTANVIEGENGRYRGCAQCEASLEALILRAWQPTTEAEALGRWLPTNPLGGEYPSYQISQLYRPNIDLDAIAAALDSPKVETAQEAYNQNLGVPYNPPGGRFPFLREYFASARYDAGDVAYRNRAIGRWLSFDTALKDKDSSDYTAWSVAELQPDYTLLVREVSRARMQFPDLPATIEAVATRYNRDDKLRGVLIEDKGSGTSAFQTLSQAAPAWLRAMLVPFQPLGSKEYRANQASVWARLGCILIPQPSADAPWLADFEDELFKFPLVAHDDQVDAFTQVTIYLEHFLAEGYRARTGIAV